MGGTTGPSSKFNSACAQGVARVAQQARPWENGSRADGCEAQCTGPEESIMHAHAAVGQTMEIL